MKIKIQVICTLLISVILWSSCKKDKKDNTVPCFAGKGGKVTIVVYAQHNGVSIINSSTNPDTAYVKFNASTSPGLSPANYDTFYVSEEGEDHIHCTELKCGDYFIYRTAFDTTTVPGTRYSGTTSISLVQTSGEKDLVIPVN